MSVVVGHAQDADRELSEGFGAYPVALAPIRVIVDAAVELEDEALRRAMEVAARMRIAAVGLARMTAATA